jgi:hypothetical protein
VMWNPFLNYYGFGLIINLLFFLFNHYFWLLSQSSTGVTIWYPMQVSWGSSWLVIQLHQVLGGQLTGRDHWLLRVWGIHFGAQ